MIKFMAFYLKVWYSYQLILAGLYNITNQQAIFYNSSDHSSFGISNIFLLSSSSSPISTGFTLNSSGHSLRSAVIKDTLNIDKNWASKNSSILLFSTSFTSFSVTSCLDSLSAIVFFVPSTCLTSKLNKYIQAIHLTTTEPGRSVASQLS